MSLAKIIRTRRFVPFEFLKPCKPSEPHWLSIFPVNFKLRVIPLVDFPNPIPGLHLK